MLKILIQNFKEIFGSSNDIFNIEKNCLNFLIIPYLFDIDQRIKCSIKAFLNPKDFLDSLNNENIISFEVEHEFVSFLQNLIYDDYIKYKIKSFIFDKNEIILDLFIKNFKLINKIFRKFTTYTYYKEYNYIIILKLFRIQFMIYFINYSIIFTIIYNLYFDIINKTYINTIISLLLIGIIVMIKLIIAYIEKLYVIGFVDRFQFIKGIIYQKNSNVITFKFKEEIKDRHYDIKSSIALNVMYYINIIEEVRKLKLF